MVTFLLIMLRQELVAATSSEFQWFLIGLIGVELMVELGSYVMLVERWGGGVDRE
jgi:hypothetical protein